jgi:hypothetical protein
VAGLFEGNAFEKNGAELEGEVPGLLVEVVLPEEDAAIGTNKSRETT